MRRRAGVGAIQKKKLEGERYKDKGNVLAENQTSEMARQLDTFRNHLEAFARDHKHEIKKDATFRQHFQVPVISFASKVLSNIIPFYVRKCVPRLVSTRWHQEKAFGPRCWELETFITNSVSRLSKSVWLHLTGKICLQSRMEH